MNSVATILRFEYRQRAFFTLAVLSGIFVGAYLFLLNQTIRDVVAVEDTQRSLSVMHSEVGDLESQYLLARSKVNLDTAKALGFQDVPASGFLSRSAERTRLTLVNEI